MKNVEKAERVHLGKLIEEIKYGRYVIPDFQRDFDWKPWDVQDLIKSIFKDYYIGTLLLWKGSKGNFDVLTCKPIYGFNGDERAEQIVLDGQQRLTAMHYAFFAPAINFPERKNPFVYFLDITGILDEDFEGSIWYESKSKSTQKFLDDKNAQFDSHCFPLGVMSEGGWGISDWIKEYRDYWQEIHDNYDNYDCEEDKDELLKYTINATGFKNLIEDLLNNYYVSYIELDQNIEIGKVCDIFTHINSRGVRLDIFDLLNAILRPKDVFLKRMWKEQEVNLEYTDSKKMKIYVLQVMSILIQNYCSSKFLYYLVPDAIKTIKKEDGSKEEIVLIKSNEEFERKWFESVDAIKKTIQTLSNPRDYGAISSKFVPYPSIIPAFSAIKKYVEKADFKNKVDINIKIKKWYWSSIFLNKYSSSVESTSAKDFQDLKKWFQDDSAILESVEEFIETYRDLGLKRQTTKGSAIYNAIYNIFILNEARDWSTLELPEYDTLDDHHIVPNSWGKKHVGKDINSILNRTPLSSQTNRNIISDKLPNVYLKEMLENNDEVAINKVLRSHLISKKAVEILLRENFDKDDYYEFIDERQKSIYDAIENLILKEDIQTPPHLKELDLKIEKIEIAIRDQISDQFKDQDIKEIIPSHIQEKLRFRITNSLKKTPHLSATKFSSLRAQLDYFDLQEYLALMTSKKNWVQFESIYKNKTQLMLKFSQLGELRNAIRHSREVSDVVRMEGEAAILWFNNLI